MSDHHQVFDRTAVMDGLGGDLELYHEIVRLFLNHYPSEIEALNKALGESSYERLQGVAHSVKGATSNFATKRANEAARNLEQAMKAGAAEEAPKLTHELIAALEELGGALKADAEASAG